MAKVSVAEQRGLVLAHGQVQPWISGTFHYWRVKPDFWAPILENIKKMGFEMVETYIPWGVHEIERGRFEFGETDAEKNLEKFFQLVHQAGLKLIVRPGPHINAELTHFGYPSRLMYDPLIAATEASGGYSVHDAAPKAFANPSYASQKLYNETALWFDALAPLLKRNLHPQGPIVSLQVDNETGYFFRTGAYLLDYSPESIGWYRTFLEKRHGTLKALNDCYGSRYASFEGIEPPRYFAGEKYQDLPYYLDWSRYKEWQINECMRRIAEMWRERGITEIPFFQNFFGPVNSPYNTNEAEQGNYGLEVVGLDDYQRKEVFFGTSRKSAYLAGSSKLPFIPEFGSGCWSFHLWENALNIGDQQFTTPLLFMYGLKAINYYMIVERDRWMGSPITVDNKIRKPYFDFYAGWNAFLAKTAFHQWDPPRDLLLLANYDIERAIKAMRVTEGHFLHFLPDELAYPDKPPMFQYLLEEECPRWTDNQWRYILKNHLPAFCSDTIISSEKMEGYKAVWVPTFEFMDQRAQKNLRRFAEEGGTVLMGPLVPSLDENLRPHSEFKELQNAFQANVGKGKLVLLREWNEKEIGRILTEAGVQSVAEWAPPEILCTRFKKDGKEILFFANPAEKTVSFPSPMKKGLVALWGAEGTVSPGQTIELKPWSVTVWEVRP